MNTKEQFKQTLFSVNDSNFAAFALQLFRYQAQHNAVHAQYLQALGVELTAINSLHDIPFLPIELYKSHTIKTGEFTAPIIFESSGTGNQIRSKNHLADALFYQKVSTRIFEQQYGKLSDYIILALLPSYLERGNSSLVYMVDYFVAQTKNADSGFYLYDYKRLAEKLQTLKNSNKKVILWGVTFALLDFSAQYPLNLPELLVIDTGGMKGRGKELTRLELNEVLAKNLGTTKLHTEYGMTELMSQAYAAKNGVFTPPAWMRILSRETSDPFSYNKIERAGGINIIDLANIDTCAFIETSDLGKCYANNRFEVLGRFDTADVRGCNLLYV